MLFSNSSFCLYVLLMFFIVPCCHFHNMFFDFSSQLLHIKLLKIYLPRVVDLLSWLKKKEVIRVARSKGTCKFCRSEVQARHDRILCLGSHGLKSRCCLSLHFISGAQVPIQAHSGCWQNLTPCGGRTEDPAFLLAFSCGLLLAPRSCPPFPATWPYAQLAFAIL